MSSPPLTPVSNEPKRSSSGWSSSRTPLLSESRGDRSPIMRASSLKERIDAFSHSDPGFSSQLDNIEEAIDANIQPELITQGSSGSYFTKNTEGVTVGVFKPKNEEPYGHLNPKWAKYMQRMACPCMFGRPCLVLNVGYMSEAGAYMVDQYFNLDIVPMTKVVRLSSPSFFYSKIVRLKVRAVRKASAKFPESLGKNLRQDLPQKVGSLQMFVKGYKDAIYWMKKWDWNKVSEDFKQSFQSQFERLVVLDYLIRNTDRGMDNWLIRCEVEEGGSESCPTSVRISAIDNGLAFPHKHPDNWRAYPYHWAYLEQAKTPFSDATANKILPLLCDDGKIEELVRQLHDLFRLDENFSRNEFEKQMAVLRGQIVNLREALRQRKSPEQLVRMPNATVVLHKRRSSTGERLRSYKQIVTKRLPFFRNW
eukprot:m.68077 g.68077  ORF g.68077 m.68077 type:complete len:422 (-) comp23908_c2_seq2:327-1592(-)